MTNRKAGEGIGASGLGALIIKKGGGSLYKELCGRGCRSPCYRPGVADPHSRTGKLPSRPNSNSNRTRYAATVVGVVEGVGGGGRQLKGAGGVRGGRQLGLAFYMSCSAGDWKDACRVIAPKCQLCYRSRRVRNRPDRQMLPFQRSIDKAQSLPLSPFHSVADNEGSPAYCTISGPHRPYTRHVCGRVNTTNPVAARVGSRRLPVNTPPGLTLDADGQAGGGRECRGRVPAEEQTPR